MNKVAIIAGLLLLGVGGYYVYNQYTKLNSICFTMSGYEISKINRERITIIVRVNVKNKSDIPIKLNAYDFGIYLNNAFVGKITSVNPISNKPMVLDTIGPNAKSVLSLVIDVEPKKIKSLANWDFISKILLDVNNTVIKITGNISATIAGFGIKNYPLLIESKIKDIKPDNSVPTTPC